jgi:hypothetical protein
MAQCAAGALQPGSRRETAGKMRAAGRPKPSAITDRSAERFNGELHGGHRASASRRSATGAVNSQTAARSREERGHSDVE